MDLSGFTRHLARGFIALVIALTMVACGGGGSGSGGGSTSTGPSNPVPTTTITRDNAPQVAASVSQTTEDMIGASGTSGGGFLPFASGLTRSASADFDIAHFAKERLLRVVRDQTAPGAQPFVTETSIPCESGTGTLTVSDTGSFTETFTNCHSCPKQIVSLGRSGEVE